MTSPFGKFLAPIVVPTGGWAWVCDAGTATIPAGTYATPLHLAETLEDQIISEIDTGTVVVSSVGITTITITGMTSVTWASCADALLTALGFDETEPVAATVVVSTSAHTHGWYPGTITEGVTGGIGISSDNSWEPEDLVEGNRSGAGQQAIVGPDRDVWSRTLMFGVIKRPEKVHPTRGPLCFGRVDKWRTKNIWWYPDRDDGVAGTYGTQGDPADDDTDSDCDYYIVTVLGTPRFTPHASHPDFFTFQLRLNAEPD